MSTIVLRQENKQIVLNFETFRTLGYFLLGYSLSRHDITLRIHTRKEIHFRYLPKIEFVYDRDMDAFEHGYDSSVGGNQIVEIRYQVYSPQTKPPT